MESDREFRRMRRIVGWSIVGLVITVGTLIVLSIILGGSTGVRYFPFRFFSFFGFGWILVPLLFFGLFFAFRWFFFWPWGWGYGRGYWGDEAYYILRERYAKGEITKEQYEQMKQDLERSQR